MNKIARIINGKIVYTEEHAPASLPNEMQARANREDMKVRHRKDLLQRNEVAYYRAYPEQAKNLSDETRRLLS
jgi:hypothetical protein